MYQSRIKERHLHMCRLSQASMLTLRVCFIGKICSIQPCDYCRFVQCNMTIVQEVVHLNCSRSGIKHCDVAGLF